MRKLRSIIPAEAALKPIKTILSLKANSLSDLLKKWLDKNPSRVSNNNGRAL